MNRKHKTGFTIVELLIVIVVIAILAAITIIAYTGIQQRAANSRVISLASQWERTIKLYQVESQLLPNDWTCLGNSVDDFPADHSQQIGPGQCERNMILINPSPDWTSEFKIVPTAGQTVPTADLLRSNATLPSGELDMYEAGSNGYIRGIVYASIFEPARAPDSRPGAFIFYALRNQECPSGDAHRVVDDIHVCANRLTTDNYVNEIFQAD